MAVDEIHYQLNAFYTGLETFLQNVCGPKFYDDIKRFAFRHPFILTGILSVGIFSAVPLLFFLGFIVITLFIALICFLCIEGSLIAFGGLIFVGVVSFITVIVAAIVSSLAVTTWFLQKLRIALHKATYVSPPAITNNRPENNTHASN